MSVGINELWIQDETRHYKFESLRRLHSTYSGLKELRIWSVEKKNMNNILSVFDNDKPHEPETIRNHYK